MATNPGKYIPIIALIAAVVGLGYLELWFPAWKSPLRIAEGFLLVAIIFAAVLTQPKRKP